MWLGLAAAIAWANAGAETKLADEIQRTYDQAVRAAGDGQPVKALVLLEGLLMVRPVSLRIERSTLPAPELRYEQGVRQAIIAWNRIPESPFFLTEASGADFTVRFVDQMPDRAHVQGLVQAQRNFRWTRTSREYTLTGTITVQRLTRGRLLSNEEAGGVVAHEIGHLFGLGDVSDPDMLMGPFFPGKPRREPSEAELRRVVEFRRFLREQADRLRPTVEATLAFLPNQEWTWTQSGACRACPTPPARRASS